MRPRRGAGCDPGVLVRQESRCGQDQKAPGLERDSGHSSRPHYRDQVAVDPAAGAGRFDRRAGCDRRGAVARIAKLLNISRHCEERSDEAIQLQTRRTMDCFAALAMTGRKFDSNFKQQICFRVLAARLARGLHVVVPQKREQGMPDARCTRGPVCKRQNENRTRAYRFSGEQSDIPCAMALRLISRSPRSIGLSCLRRLTETGTLARLGFRTSVET
jgi:hypothetical protein